MLNLVHLKITILGMLNRKFIWKKRYGLTISLIITIVFSTIYILYAHKYSFNFIFIVLSQSLPIHLSITYFEYKKIITKKTDFINKIILLLISICSWFWLDYANERYCNNMLNNSSVLVEGYVSGYFTIMDGKHKGTYAIMSYEYDGIKYKKQLGYRKPPLEINDKLLLRISTTDPETIQILEEISH